MIAIDRIGGDYGYAYDINDSDQVVGYSDIPGGGNNAFVWTREDGTLDLGNLGRAVCSANGNNDSGQVVGMSETGEYIAHLSFFWTENDGMVPLQTIDEYRSYSANDINNGGQIVGPASGYAGPFEDDAGNEIDYDVEKGLLWYDGAVYDLNDLVIDASGWDYIGPGKAINDPGQIIGVGKLQDIVDEDGNVVEVGKRHGYLLTPDCTDLGGDTDEDGVCDDSDNCLNTPNPGQANSDGDSVGDECDGCPDDPNKTEPGECGCGTLDADTDDDGTPDCNDECPNSDMSATVVIDGCDTGVGNQILNCCCNISDRITECATGTSEHRQFVRCINSLTKDLKKAGLITGKEKSVIQKCARKANIP